MIKFIKLKFDKDDISNPPWERNFRRVIPPCSILGAQTRGNKKSAGSEICERVQPEYERAKKGGSDNEARSCPTDSKFQDTLQNANCDNFGRLVL